MSLEARYRARHPGSAALYEQALTHFPSGVTHDGRFMQPFPIAVAHAAGAYKWDVDGNQVIDYWQGHGALLLGHSHPSVVAAVQGQVARGTHFGANHALEIAWADAVKACFPSIERLRFTASGTEATLLALRLARAYTNKPRVLRFTGHFHGWHDLVAQDAPDKLLPGTLRELTAGLQVIPPDLDVLTHVLEQRDDVAAVILEPSGASYGTHALPDDFLRAVRYITAERNVLLICDEVVTGFRVLPGGVQQRAGIQADLTTLAKILAGGLPGGAVGGRAEVLAHLAFGNAEWNATRKIVHQGTYNANPLSAAAGIAALGIARSGEPQRIATSLAQCLIHSLNDLFQQQHRHGWVAYGDASIMHVVAGAQARFPAGELPTDLPLDELKRGGDPQVQARLRLALLIHGVDLMRGKSAFVSAAHTTTDIDATIAAFDAALSEINA